jgi:hypothetical protein
VTSVAVAERAVHLQVDMTAWQHLDRGSKIWALTVFACCVLVLAIMTIWTLG